MVAPDGGCVGTGTPWPWGPRGMNSGESRRGLLPCRESTTDLWRIPHRTDAATARSTRCAPVDPCPGVSRSARHEPARRLPQPSPGQRRLPAAGGVDRRPTGAEDRSAPTAAGGTPPRRPTSPNTAPTSGTPTSCGARRGCARPRHTCSGTSRAAGPGDRLRLGPVRTLAAEGRGRGRRARHLGRDARPGSGAAPAPPGRRPLVQADAGALPLRAGSVDVAVRPSAGCRSSPTSRERWPRSPGCCARAGGSSRRQPPAALAVPGLPRPEDLRVVRPTSTGRPTSRPRTGAGPSTSSTTVRSATGCARSSEPAWCSTAWSSRSGRRAAPRNGASGPPSAAPSFPAP